MSDTWVSEIPGEDLSTLHHGLRLSAEYPGMSDDERAALSRLADLCWDEHCRRTNERISRRGSQDHIEPATTIETERRG